MYRVTPPIPAQFQTSRKYGLLSSFFIALCRRVNVTFDLHWLQNKRKRKRNEKRIPPFVRKKTNGGGEQMCNQNIQLFPIFACRLPVLMPLLPGRRREKKKKPTTNISCVSASARTGHTFFFFFHFSKKKKVEICTLWQHN